MNKLILLGLLAIWVGCTAPPSEEATEAEEVPEEAAPEEEEHFLEVNLEKIQKEGGFEAPRKITVSRDAVFKRTKSYEAIPLKPYLKQLIETEKLDTASLEIIFLCKDGYNPSMPLSKVMTNEPYLAIKDYDAAPGQNWVDTLKGLWSPYYLVWTNHSEGPKGFTWPYGLKYIQFKNSEAAYKNATPQDDDQALAGFKIFKEKCIKCHSINKVGGILGPEFNIPKNITEYWNKEDFIAFAKNPYAYRYNSRMPPVVGITDQDLKQILVYLDYMKDHKVEE